MSKEARARIKINQLLQESGWRFFPENGYPANILLEGKADIPSHEFSNTKRKLKINDRIAKVWGEEPVKEYRLEEDREFGMVAEE